MPVNLVAEDDLRSALRPFRVDPDAFEVSVRARLEAAQSQHAVNPLVGLSPFLRSAAAYLPMPLLAGCQVSAAKQASSGITYKLLSYLAFPAISLFVLLGATVFSVTKIRRLRMANDGVPDQFEAQHEAVRGWWSHHKWGAFAVFAVTLILSLVGATWLLFVMYIISFGILLFVLSSFAQLGLGNRQVIGSSCLTGLMFLGQFAAFSGIGHQDIHFLDQNLVAAVFIGGALVLAPFSMAGIPPWQQRSDSAVKRRRWPAAVLFAAVVLPLLAWWMNPILWPVTPVRIRQYVESFDRAPFEMVSWRRWEIVADWAIRSNLAPDLSRPRRLLAEEIVGGQNRFILGSALRVGLMPVDQLGRLREYDALWRSLVKEPPRGMKPQVITSIEQYDWVIRAAVLRNDLTPAERDLLEQRLLITLEKSFDETHIVLADRLRVTRLLEVLDRPINRDQYRQKIHDLLRKFHTTNTGGFQLAGGFKTYLNWPAGAWISQAGALEPTANAVELMEIYGVPDDLDLNWVRSFLKPSASRLSDDKWVAAATLHRLNELPGVTPPTWLEVMYYERSLLAAAVLVGLCLYATLCSPVAKTIRPAGEPAREG